MTASQTRLVLWALVVAESAWVFAILGVAGLWMGQDSGPLSWPTIMVLMFVSLYLGRLSPSKVMGPVPETLVRMLFGILFIYVAIAIELSDGLPRIDVLWVFKAFSSSEPDQFWFRFLAGGLAAAALWLRAGKLGIASFPTEELGFSFRLGIPLLALATLIDLINDAHLHTFLMVFVFFGASLAGLALGNLLPRSQTTGPSIWPRVVFGVVAVVVVTGLAFSLLPGGVLDAVSWPLRRVFDLFLLVFVWVLIIPAAFVISSVIEGIIWIYSFLFGASTGVAPSLPGQELATTTPSVFDQVEDLEGSGANIWIMQILLGLILGVAAIALLYAGAKAFRRPQSRRAVPVEGHRESVMEDADPLLDFTNLLRNLMPSWLKGDGEETFVLPDGPPGIVKVLELYYDMLLLAEERGVERQPHETPGEMQTRLGEIFPNDLVNAATSAFVRAFYGSYPSSDEQIAEMRASVDGLAAEPA